MNPQQFNKAWEKLKQAPCKANVLQLVLAGYTNAEIARLRGRAEGTVRKQISQIYKDFAITSELPGDLALRDKLKALFRKYEPEWITNSSSTLTTQVSNEEEKENERDETPMLSSSIQGKDLISLATSMLEQLGFDKKFKVIRAAQHLAYRLKNPKIEVNKSYQIVLAYEKEGLYVSIPRETIEHYLLQLKYYVDTVESDYGVYTITVFLWVLPSKTQVFLDSLHRKYWLLLSGEIVGKYYLNDCEDDGFGYYKTIPIILLEEFRPETLSKKSSYLILREDNLLSDTLQTCINSSEVLREFIEHFGKILIENQGRNVNLDDDDIDF